MTFTRKFVGPKSIAIGALVSSIIMGVIVSLIGAAIFKKERSPFDVVSTSDQTSEPTV
jgi:LytS/YehU family sensor histidine kinase